MKQMKLNIDVIGKILSGVGLTINSSKVIDDSATEPTKGINPVINDVKERKEIIQKVPEGSKIIAVSSDGTIQYTIEIDAKQNLVNFDGLRLEGISSFNASQTNGGIQSDISILEDGTGVLVAREGDLEYYLTLKGANGFEIEKIQGGAELEYIPTDKQIVVGKNLSDLKIEVNGKVEGINGVITFDKDTIYEEGGLIKAKAGLTPEEGKLLFSNKVNYDTQTGSKAILNATSGNEMEFKVGELAQPSLLLEQNGINMLNGRIIKTDTSKTNDSTLVNKAEVKELIANASVGDWTNIYDNGTLNPADDGEGNYYYVFSPDSSNLDKFTQSGEKDYVAVPRTDLYFSTELNKTFYDFSVVADFSDLYGAGSGGIWLETTLTIAANQAEKFQNKEFIVYVKAKESGSETIYNSKVLKLDFNYLMTFKNGYAELQLNEQFNYQLEEYVSSTDTKPKISNGTWLTSDKDFRINKTDMLDVGSVDLSDYLLKTEAQTIYLSKTEAQTNYLKNGDATFKSGEKVKDVDYLGTSNESAINGLENNKQNKLIAGTNITITGDTISATSGEVWEDIGYSIDSDKKKITLDLDFSLFSKIKVVGAVKFSETSNRTVYLNVVLNIDDFPEEQYFYVLAPTNTVRHTYNVQFYRFDNKIGFIGYDIPNDKLDILPEISNNSEIKIKGVRK